MTKKIKANGNEYGVKSFIKAGNTLIIVFPDEGMSVSKIASEISADFAAAQSIEYSVGGEAVETASGYGELDSVSKVSGGYRAEFKKAHTLTARLTALEAENARLTSENESLTEQITALELALCEMYEGGIGINEDNKDNEDNEADGGAENG